MLDCQTRYYPNYYVHSNPKIRTYYRGPFDYLQVATHVYIESRVCELFSTMMVMSWYILYRQFDVGCSFSFRTSGTNCARIYNDGLALKSLSPSLPAAHSKSLSLDVDDVWDSLCLHWLLEDCEERDYVLELPHDVSTQAKCLQTAMVARNSHMAGPGQEEWNHGCDLCCWFETNEEGKRGEIHSTPDFFWLSFLTL